MSQKVADMYMALYANVLVTAQAMRSSMQALAYI